MRVLFKSVPEMKARFLPWNTMVGELGFQAKANFTGAPSVNIASLGLAVMKGRSNLAWMYDEPSVETYRAFTLLLG